MAIKDLLLKLRLVGAKKTKDDLKGVEGGIAKMGKAAAKAGAVFFAAKGIVSGLSSVIELAAQQELAEKQLSTALGRTSKNLLEQASALQKVTTFGDEVIISQQAFLASLKFNEEQIKSIISASVDLSAATGISLESAVRNTAKTFSGLSGELGELIPQLRDLTAEEMKAGEAVKVIADLFGGQAKETTNTLAGSIEQMKNQFGDLGEELGFILKPAVISVTNSLSGMASMAVDAIQKTKSAMATARRAISDFIKGEDTRTLEDFGLEANTRIVELKKEEFGIEKMKLDLLPVVVDKNKQIADESKKAAQFTANTAQSLFTSAIMGDNVSDSLKRAVVQLGVMVAQAKIYNAIMNSAGLFTGGGIIGGITKFLFGQSPTQASPSANITINQTFQGGMVDHNFAANNLIPAINKAISTGQARINR
jgi:hypothetical protein